jgi:hypothetical protein
MIGLLLGLAIWAAFLAGIRALRPRFNRGCRRGCLVVGLILWITAAILAAALIAIMANA